MSYFLKSNLWNFPSNNNGGVEGIGNSGVETFRGTSIKSLAREICQNSIDAHLDNEEPVVVDFMQFTIRADEIPGMHSLKDAFYRAKKFWEIQKSKDAKEFFNKAIRVADNEMISCLRISDHNTTGLTGSDKEYNSHWCNLTKSSGVSDKCGINGGSFGIGKFAPYACSTFRTVFYSTADCEKKYAYQGVARLTTFENEKGEKTQATGFFGNDKNTPVPEQLHMDPGYRRDEMDSGTDIYIIAFNGEQGWENKIISSIIDGFLYAIYSGNLVINVGNTVISKNTLPELIVSHKNYFEDNADKYYEVLNSDESISPKFVKEITDDGVKGKLILRLMIRADMHRRVAMVRQTGMKIKDKGHISGFIPFAGVLYIEGEELNSYLRNLENPQHLEWEVGRAEVESKAKKLLSGFTKFIKAKLNDMKNDDSNGAIDPVVGEYLSINDDEDSKEENKKESLTEETKSIITKKIPVKENTDNEKNKKGKTKSTEDDQDGEIETDDIPGEGGRNGDGKGGKGTGGGGDGDGTAAGDTPTQHKKTIKLVKAVRSRVICNDKKTGKYVITFVPANDAENGHIKIFMAAESQNYDAGIIGAKFLNGASLEVEKNCIKGIEFEKNKPLKILIELNYYDYCSMEVKAYGYKK